ncbi:MAG: NAD(+)/NADH kinase [Pseudomonadales bacterium]
MATSLGIVVNPMSGRDVRRVAAKASTSNHHEKQQQVTRLVLGALEMGVDQIYLGNEPFRINERAVENLQQRDQVTVLSYPLTHTAADTVTMTSKMWDAGVRTFIVLGGDGTSRIVAKNLPDAVILPLSTGTNNVFPIFSEASIAGAAAGLIASKRLKAENHCYRCKQVHVCVNDNYRDLALVDAILLQNDSLGSLLPFAAENIRAVFLARSEPASVGISPIGGYLQPSGARDDFGVMVNCSPDAPEKLRVPLSPGLYGDVGIVSHETMEIGQTYRLGEAGILAFDGDRTLEVKADDRVEISVRQDGPWIIDPQYVLAVAANHGLLQHEHTDH